MTFERKIISYVSFSDETSDFLRIGLVNYNEKSFALAIEYLNDLNKNTLSKKQKHQMEEVKKFFGKSDDPEFDSLNGMGNTNLSYEDGNKFFGYIFSIKTGQKAVDWFADRSSNSPTRRELQTKLDKENDDTIDPEEYLNVFERKTKKQLYEILEMSETKAASKNQKKPVYTTKGPTFESTGAKSTTKNVTTKVQSPIMGLPKSTKAKRPTLQEALDIVIEAFNDGTIDETYMYSKECEAAEDEDKRVIYFAQKKSKALLDFTKSNDITKDQVSELKGPSIFYLIKSKEE